MKFKSKKRADFGIVAIENSIAGAILENYDRVRENGVEVVGGYYLLIVHNLLALPASALLQLTKDIPGYCVYCLIRAIIYI